MEKEFHVSVKKNPEKLVNILNKIVEIYELCKVNSNEQPQVVLPLLQDSLNKLFYIKRLPKDCLPISDSNYTQWVRDLDRISDSCQDMLLNLKTPKSVQNSYNSDWFYPTLQEENYKNVLNVFFSPLLSDLIQPSFVNLVIKGRKKIGKSFFLSRVKEYLHAKKVDFVCREWNSEVFTQTFPQKWKMFIVDVDYVDYPIDQDLMGKIELFRKKTDNVLIIFLTSHDLDIQISNVYKAEFLPPNAASIFNFIKVYYQNQVPDSNVPIVQSVKQLHDLSQKIARNKFSFVEVLELLRMAEHVTRENEMLQNVILVGENKVFSQNSIVKSRIDNYKKALIRPIEKSTVRFQGVDYANSPQHFSFSNDKFRNIYMGTTEENVLNIICELTCKVNKKSLYTLYDYNLADLFLRYWLSTVNMYDSNRDLSMSHLKGHKMDMRLFEIYNVDKVQDYVNNIKSETFIIYAQKDSTFSITYGVTTINDIPYNVKAEDLRERLNNVIDCQVTQLTVSDDVVSFLIKSNTKLTNYPLIKNAIMYPLLYIKEFYGIQLPKQYCITNENDLDMLQERYPQEYSKMYRDEENTWKMKPIISEEHIDFLNNIYSDEQKFYLTIYFSLLKLYESSISLLDEKKRELLISLTSSLQFVLDFLFYIVSENDENQVWNGVWSLSKNHDLYEKYNSMIEDNNTRTFPPDITIEMLRNRSVFLVSPYWFINLYNFLDMDLKSLYKNWYNFNEEETVEYIPLMIKTRVNLQKTYRYVNHILVNKLAESKVTDINTISHLQYFISRYKESFYAEVFRNATHFSWNGGHWFSVKEDSVFEENITKICKVIEKSNQALWNYVCNNLNSQPHLFSAAFALLFCINSRQKTLTDFLAYLLFMNGMYNMSLGETIEDILGIYNIIIKQLFDKFDYVLKFMKIKEISEVKPLLLNKIVNTTEMKLEFIKHRNDVPVIKSELLKNVIVSCLESYVVEDVINILKL
jgi:hypothetical protein